MGALRLLVADGNVDLRTQLERAFAYEQPMLIVDRRRTDRRRGTEPEAAERRNSERRRWTRIDDDLLTRGFAVLNGDGGDPAGDDVPLTIPHTAMRSARVYLQDRFPHHTTLSWWNGSRDAQSCIVLSAAAHPAHRVLFLGDFLTVYGSSRLDQMHRILDEWKLMDQVLASGTEPVTVSAYGIRRGER